MKADQAQERPQFRLVAAIGRGENQPPDLRGAGLIGGELQRDMNLTGLEIFAVKLTLAHLEINMRMTRPPHRGDD